MALCFRRELEDVERWWEKRMFQNKKNHASEGKHSEICIFALKSHRVAKAFMQSLQRVLSWPNITIFQCTMIKKCVCFVCVTLFSTVAADISVIDSEKSSLSKWYDDIVLNEKKPYQIWILSIIASCVIGLSGILPLIIIPFESGSKFDQKGKCLRSITLLHVFEMKVTKRNYYYFLQEEQFYISLLNKLKTTSQ